MRSSQFFFPGLTLRLHRFLGAVCTPSGLACVGPLSFVLAKFVQIIYSTSV
jgi:hypothetical protein